MYIVIILCLYIRQNLRNIKFSSFLIQRSLGNFDMGITQYQYWLLQVSIFGKFPKMPYKLLTVLANTLAIIEMSSISLIGYSNTFICVAIWEISTISPYFWLIGSKKRWHLSKFHYFHHKIPCGPCFVQVLCRMYGQTQIFPLFSPYIGSLVIKAVAFDEISSFAHFVLCLIYGPTQN